MHQLHCFQHVCPQVNIKRRLLGLYSWRRLLEWLYSCKATLRIYIVLKDHFNVYFGHILCNTSLFIYLSRLCIENIIKLLLCSQYCFPTFSKCWFLYFFPLAKWYVDSNENKSYYITKNVFFSMFFLLLGWLLHIWEKYWFYFLQNLKVF